MPEVCKDDGMFEELEPRRLTKRIRELGRDLKSIDPDMLTEKIVAYVRTDVTLRDLDDHTSRVAAELTLEHPEYALLAGRVWLDRLEKTVPPNFSDAMRFMYLNGIIGDELFTRVLRRENYFDNLAREPHYDIDYFGIQTLARSYLVRVKVAGRNGTFDGLCETPSYMWLRVALSLNPGDDERAELVYHSMRRGLYTHASPTLFNAGTLSRGLASCYLLQLNDPGLVETSAVVNRCQQLSKHGGGVGLSLSRLPAENSTNSSDDCEKSPGIVAFMKFLNEGLHYVNRYGGKRAGAFAVYLEIWHADVEDFIGSSSKVGDESKLTRDLFQGLWVCDLFMRRALGNDENAVWSLMCPSVCPDLVDLYGVAFERAYERYEQMGLYKKQISARGLLAKLMSQQIETGVPYFLFKDTVNIRSNQRHRGTVVGSNLCTEITLPTVGDEIAVCNLASLSLPSFVIIDSSDKGCNCQRPALDPDCPACQGGFDYVAFRDAVCELVENLDNSIDVSSYCLKQASDSNRAHRPLGIGVQGFAHLLQKLGLRWEDDAARVLNRRIFEVMYRASLEQSCRLAQERGTYSSYNGSPASEGKLTPDLWNEWCDLEAGRNDLKILLSDDDWIAKHARSWKQRGATFPNWTELRAMVKRYGLRNSERTTIMPTASTSQILGNSESIEPLASNIFQRRVASGEFIVVNKQMVRDLGDGWNKTTRNEILSARGSVRSLGFLNERAKDVYATASELSPYLLIDYMSERQPWLDQSASNNIFLTDPDSLTQARILNRAWKKGLKTGSYYTRTSPASEPLTGLAMDTYSENVEKVEIYGRSPHRPWYMLLTAVSYLSGLIWAPRRLGAVRNDHTYARSVQRDREDCLACSS